MNKPAQRWGLASALLLPATVLAHTAEGAGHLHGAFLAGLLHPFSGVDHLAAMLALGVWSALALRRAWLAPAAFVLMLAIGALAGFQGLAVPAVEPMVAASVLVLGLLLASRRHLPLMGAAALAGLFAFFHGAAHGHEMAGAGQWLAWSGMLLATAALHASGILLGRTVFTGRRWLASCAGAAVALLGSSLLLQMA